MVIAFYQKSTNLSSDSNPEYKTVTKSAQGIKQFLIGKPDIILSSGMKEIARARPPTLKGQFQNKTSLGTLVFGLSFN